jgi:hypothetical protein
LRHRTRHPAGSEPRLQPPRDSRALVPIEELFEAHRHPPQHDGARSGDLDPLTVHREADQPPILGSQAVERPSPLDGLVKRLFRRHVLPIPLLSLP